MGLPYTTLESPDSIQTIFQTVDAQSCPFFYNFHLHTRCSDGRLHPVDLIQQAVHYGLKGLAITDHHNVMGYYMALGWLAEVKARSPHQSFPALWSGVEITAMLLEVDVHILGYGFDPNHPKLQDYLGGHSPRGVARDSRQVIDAIQQAGGIAVLAHPARYKKPPEVLIPMVAEQGIDGVEAYYCYSHEDPWVPSQRETQTVKQLGGEYNLLQTCGTDTHGLDILRRL
jgi:predicted metal-dependent phosphoesterase TrpH